MPLESMLSGAYITATYHLHMAKSDASAMAKLIAYEHTLELSPDKIPPRLKKIIGKVTELEELKENLYHCKIAYVWELAANNLPGLLGLIMGNASFFPGVELIDMALPKIAQTYFKGPKFGIKGIRKQLNKPRGAISGTALKPLGFTEIELGKIAYSFALGGMDIIKEDDGITDQSFAPFKERVLRCTDAMQNAYTKTNKKTLYIPNITGPIDQIQNNALFAQQAGADGVEVLPGLLGFDIIRLLSQMTELHIPIYTHSSWNGGFCRTQSSAISYAAIFGLLPRISGADVSIAPTFGGRFGLSKTTCKNMDHMLKRDYLHMHPSLPMVGGGICLDNISEILSVYKEDCIVLISDALFQTQGNLKRSTKQFVDVLDHHQKV